MYSASKAALKSLTESMREELRGKCYVGIVCPGFTKTDIFRNQGSSDEKAQKMKIISISGKEAPASFFCALIEIFAVIIKVFAKTV